MDALRGVAIVAMVVYHIAWDLYFLSFISTDITTDPWWVALQRGIVSGFLVLVGVGLVLAHGDGIRWRGFWRRFAVILGAAVLTSIGTYVALPPYFVYFGVLHAIALFSLLGLVFVRAPVWVTLVAIVVVMVPPALFSDPIMMQRELSWIGFWPLPPPTTDIVPVFPWFGVTLIGIAGTRLIMRSALWARISGWQFDGVLGRSLRWMGRWSLLIYLVHQPVIYGGLSLMQPQAPDEIGFVSSCEASCGGNGADAPYCARYCLCALDQVNQQSLWGEVGVSPATPQVEAMTRLCSEMAR